MCVKLGKINQTISHKLQTFVKRCLRIIINGRWPEVISNHAFWGKTQAEAHISRNFKKEMEVDRIYT
jgi:hypothetical protein